jgi:serine-type D-Ala-D-Ala carboxypeptidase (penicillin-binding protein 5/6)
MLQRHFHRHHRIYWLWLPLLLFCIWGLDKSQSLSTSALARQTGSKVLAWHSSAFQPKYDYWKTHTETLPLHASSAILVDERTGEILYAQHEHDKHPPASIIKILTVATALNAGCEKKTLIVSHRAASVEPNIMGLKEGEKVPATDLIYGVFMISANDAAEALAEDCYPNRAMFIGHMSRLAQSLGLSDTRVTNPTGLDEPGTFSSAYDMATITSYAMSKHPELREMWDTKEKTYVGTESHGPYYLYNISDLIYTYPQLNGVKTGFTDNAGHTLVASAKQGNRQLLLVYLNDHQGIQDAETLFGYGFLQQD